MLVKLKNSRGKPGTLYQVSGINAYQGGQKGGGPYPPEGVVFCLDVRLC